MSTVISHRLVGSAIVFTADNVMITNRDGIIEYVNPAFETTTGYTKGEVIGKTPRILKSGKQSQQYYEDLWRTILAGEVFRAQTVNRNKAGELYVAEQTISPIKAKSGAVTHFVCVWRDITERKRLEEELANERRKLEEIIGFDEKVSTIRKFDRLIDFIMEKVVNIADARQCSIMLVDEHTGELIMRGALGLNHEIMKDTRVNVGEFLGGAVAVDQEPILVTDLKSDKRFKRAQTPKFLGNSFLSVPILLDDKMLGLIVVAHKKSEADAPAVFTDLDFRIVKSISREIAVALENIKLYKELNYLTVADPLTNTHNYRYFTKALEHEICRSNRFGRPLSLMMIDIDDFKAYNDHYGHPEGDRLLKELSRCLQDHVREIDVVCRYAGDEFVLILPETKAEAALLVGQRLQAHIKALKLRRVVTVSIGIAQFHKSMNRYDITSKADRALYEAKHEGKDKVCYIA